MKLRVEEMEREAKKLRELQAAAESSVNVEQAEGEEEPMPMETEDEKAAIDGRSVFVGNVCDLSSLLGIPRLPALHRSTIVRQQKISRHIFKLAAPSTASPSSVTSSRVTLKGT